VTAKKEYSVLLEGVDEIDFTLGYMDKIKAFEAKR
jgi:hypothetical protein